jgi:6-phosphogluconolactonase (cycloisomerase 2 family)
MRRILHPILATLLLAIVAPAPASAALTGPTLYVTNGGSDTISIFTIASNGNLSPLQAPLPTDLNPRGIVFAPGGDIAYVWHGDAQLITTYEVGSNGELTLLDKDGTVGHPFGVAVSPSGNAVFVTNLGLGVDVPAVSVFAVQSDGSLAPVGQPVPVGDGTQSARGIAVSSDGQFVVTGTGDPMNPAPGTLTTFRVVNNYTLQQVDTAQVGTFTLGIDVSSDDTVYVACGGSDRIEALRLEDDGQLTPLTTTAAPDLPVSAEISHDGRFLFTAARSVNGGTPNGVWVFQIGPSGTLKAVSNSPAPAGDTPVWPALTPDGGHLYVTNEDTSGEVFGFEVATDGELAPLTGSPFPAGGEFSMFQSAAIRG